MKLIQTSQPAEAVAAIEAGDLAIVPTNRWYMICANARDTQACQRIFEAKRRPADRSLLLILPRVEAATALFTLPRGARQLAAAFWPGDLAMILRWRDPATGHDHRPVGNPEALVTCAPGVLGAIAAKSNVPIAATSANVSGQPTTGGSPPAITVREVEEFVQTSGVGIAVCLYGGVCPTASHLTVVDCTTENVHMARPGLVHERAVSAVLHGH